VVAVAHMGGGCSSHPGPPIQYNNVCSSEVGDRITVQNACVGLIYRPGFPSPVDTTTPTDTFCKEISGEWSSDTVIAEGCVSYDDVRRAANDCGGTGAIVTCKRDSFIGDPLTCCLLDYNCKGGDACWSDQGRKQTCDPKTRSPFSSTCQPLVNQYCTGTLPSDDPSSADWLARWDPNSPNSCYNLFLRRMQLTPDPNRCSIPIPPSQQYPGQCNIPTSGIDAIGWQQNQTLLNQVIQRYQEMGYKIGTDPGQPGYNSFQEFLYTNICCPYSGMCSSALRKSCATQTSQRISLNPTTSKWCGCHLPPEEYQAYELRYGIEPQCSPMCNRADVVKQAGRNLNPLVCTTNTCIIDNVTVNLLSSNVQGGLTFSQMCGSCGSGTCSCIISYSNVNVNNSTIGGSVIPALNECGVTTCSQTNPGLYGPETITVPCDDTTSNIYQEYDDRVRNSASQSRLAGVLWSLCIIGLILVLIIILFWILY
jgi:hypothetical protein